MSQDNGTIMFMGTTATGADGKPYMSMREAALATASTSPGLYTSTKTGKTYTSERAMREDEWDREHGG